MLTTSRFSRRLLAKTLLIALLLIGLLYLVTKPFFDIVDERAAAFAAAGEYLESHADVLISDTKQVIASHSDSWGHAFSLKLFRTVSVLKEWPTQWRMRIIWLWFFLIHRM